MFTRGNGKIGQEIWGFALPSARRSTCPGSTRTCRSACYDKRLERMRPAMLAHRRRNLRLSRRPEFVPTAVALIKLWSIQVLRWGVGGDVYSAAFARKLQAVMKATRGTRHYLYSRSWRVPEIAAVLEEIARLRNVRLWYSLDRDTGWPEKIPARVRLAYLQVEHDDLPPEGVDLVFRTRKLRRVAQTRVRGARVCPPEDGVERLRKVTCEDCTICCRSAPLPALREGAFALQLVS
jgi:hypothetical protein